MGHWLLNLFRNFNCSIKKLFFKFKPNNLMFAIRQINLFAYFFYISDKLL